MPHRTAPHRTAPHRTAPHRTAQRSIRIDAAATRTLRRVRGSRSWSLVVLLALSTACGSSASPPVSVSRGSDEQPSPGQVVGWVDSPVAAYSPTTTTVPPPDPTMPPCQGRDLVASGTERAVGLGNTNLRVTLRNTSAAACWADGYPTVAGITNDGRAVPLDVDHGSYFGDPGHGGPLTPGAAARVNLSGGNACESAAHGTVVVYRSFRLGLSDSTVEVANPGLDAACGLSVSEIGVGEPIPLRIEQ
jgi:hypothetical protein